MWRVFSHVKVMIDPLISIEPFQEGIHHIHTFEAVSVTKYFADLVGESTLNADHSPADTPELVQIFPSCTYLALGIQVTRG